MHNASKKECIRKNYGDETKCIYFFIEEDIDIEDIEDIDLS